MKTRETIPQGVRFNVLRRDEFRCRYCGRSSPDVVLHCDHVIAVANGGSDDEDNLVTACSDCNFGKGTKTVDIGKPQPKEGLVGLWGHEFKDGRIEYQFRIIRRLDATNYAIQFYEFMFGEASNIESRTWEFLLSSNCKLYPDSDAWRAASDQQMAEDAGCSLRDVRRWDRAISREPLTAY